ncbi:MAG: carbohydrate ABC transporter permease, partial [Pseudomonadota bacterium]
GIIGALPATLLFLIVQKRLISGLTQGAVKG